MAYQNNHKFDLRNFVFELSNLQSQIQRNHKDLQMQERVSICNESVDTSEIIIQIIII
ncbi:unnamed protein product [Paramecium sonneborni]|uniref:Uncharacterized protein n=1 Tax=Paramecium sonneborni TaxID=65129 RepID=A0A8S1RQN6_9CILI|nr:unnamed protein product [Paramecium sonneborni]